MNADNEPAISVAVYFKSVKKWKYVLRENNKKKTKGPKQMEKKFPTARVEPRASDVKVTPLSIAPRQMIFKMSVKLIIFNTFGHEVLPVDAV